jgi:hypothetical protein
MIFSSVNEDGIHKWRLILEDIKVNGETVDVTRRLRPQPVGALRRVQPKRTESAMCIHAFSCDLNKEYCDGNYTKCESYKPLRIEIVDCVLQYDLDYPHPLDKALKTEANREGLKSWERLEHYFSSKKIDINDTYRIQFKKEDDQ